MSNSQFLYSVFFFFMSFASSTVSSYLNTNLTTHKCSTKQTHALLLFKRNLFSINSSIDHRGYSPCQDWLGSAGYYPILMNWNTSNDCCDWKGVTCDPSTGDVIGLDLSCGMLRGTIHPNTSLLHLSHLQRLNLGFNNFSGSQIPREIGTLLKSLTHLNISKCGFTGQVPTDITFLHKLVSLDIAFNDNLHIQPHIFNSLLKSSTRIRYLKLGKVDISWVLTANASNISYSFYYLNLCNCSLMGILPISPVNLTHLTFLDLSHNKLNGTLPSWLFTLPSLEYLYLDHNMFRGDLPFELFALPSLKHLLLGQNQLGGMIDQGPIQKLTNLTQLDLSFNNFSGDWELDALLSNLTNLNFLDLSYSGLFITTTNANHHVNPNLRSLYLASCKINVFPESLQFLINLARLDLSSNEIHGDIPIWVGEIGGDDQLYHLNLSHNFITGLPQFQLYGLQYIYLQSNMIQGPFPPSICNMSNLIYFIPHNIFNVLFSL